MSHAPRTPDHLVQTIRSLGPCPPGVVRESLFFQPRIPPLNTLLLAAGSSGPTMESFLQVRDGFRVLPVVSFLDRLAQEGARGLHVVNVDQQRLLVTIRNDKARQARFAQDVLETSQMRRPVIVTTMLAPVRVPVPEAPQPKRARVPPRVVQVEESAVKKRKSLFTRRPTPSRLELQDGCVAINKLVLQPWKFFFMFDANGMQHPVYTVNAYRIPGELLLFPDDPENPYGPPTWWTRLVFVNAPGWYCRITDIEAELQSDEGRFRKVHTLHGTNLKEPWWLRPGCGLPPVLDRPQVGEVVSFPRVQQYFRKGDLVTLAGHSKKFSVMSVYEYDKRKIYNIVSVAHGDPIFPVPEMLVVGNEELAGPLVDWRELTQREKWWDAVYDSFTEDKLFFMAANNTPFAPGTIVAIRTLGAVCEVARVVAPRVRDGKRVFLVQFPTTNPRLPVREFLEVPVDELSGPHLRWDVSALKWPRLTPNAPSAARPMPPPMLLIPPPLDLSHADGFADMDTTELLPPCFLEDAEPPEIQDCVAIEEDADLPLFSGDQFFKHEEDY